MRIAFITLALAALTANAPVHASTVTPNAKPTAEQLALVRKALPDQYQDASFTIGTADLNDDGKPDLIVQFIDEDWCSPTGKGCAGTVVLSEAGGYATHDTPLPLFGASISILPGKHGGLHDLKFDGGPKTFFFDGKSYNNAK